MPDLISRFLKWALRWMRHLYFLAVQRDAVDVLTGAALCERVGDEDHHQRIVCAGVQPPASARSEP